MQVWDVAKGTEACVLLGHTAAVTALCLTADHKYLFSGDASGTLMVRLLTAIINTPIKPLFSGVGRYHL